MQQNQGFQDDALAALFPEAGHVPPAVRVDASRHGARWLVDGEVRAWLGATRPVRSRVALRTADGLCDVELGVEAMLTAEDAAVAVASAARAWAGGEGRWPSMHVEERMAAVERFAVAVEDRADEVATLLMWEIGKPWKAARDEVTRSVEYLRDTLAELTRLRASDLAVQEGTAGGQRHYARTHRRPLGVAVCVAPFNYPVNEFLTTVVPALLMGNVVVAKTPRFGVLANLVLLEGFARCFPPGVVNVLPGEGRTVLPAVMGAATTDAVGNPSGVVSVLAFIGSEGAANAIIRAHPAPSTLHKILGLGAKNAAVVMADADLEAAATGIAKGALGFNGQRCTAEKLVFVHRSVLGPFLERLVAKVDARPLGLPWDEGVAHTPLPEPTKLDAMWALLDDARSAGARILNAGGGRGTHSLLRPAVVAEVTSGMRLYHEEQFGPIVPVAAFDDVEEVLEWQRRSPYGQQAAVWGQPAGARALVRRLTRSVARVNVNDVCQRGPDVFGFTATDKSGFGSLSLRDALLSFSRPVLVQALEVTVLDAFLGSDYRPGTPMSTSTTSS